MPVPEGDSGRTSDRDLLIAAVRDAGALAMTLFGKPVETWTKPDETPVTAADLAVNDLIKARLGEARPGYGWLSEETEDNRARMGKDRVWVVDPIDGTKAFIRGEPGFSIAVALLERDRPIHAVIFNPATDEFFEAGAGAGARLNGRPIQVSTAERIEGCRMLGAEGLFRHPAWPEPWPEMTLFNPNSIAYRLALVASGTWDAALALNRKHDWDLAAADLIVTEAGGRITLHSGEALHYNREIPIHRSVVAAGPALYERIFDKVGHLRLP